MAEISCIELTLFNFCLFLTCVAGNHYGVIYAEADESSSKSGYYCMMYNPRFRPVPRDASQAEKLELADMTPSVFCEEPSPAPVLTGRAVAVNRGNCTFSEKARNVQFLHGALALIISKRGLDEPNANSTSDYNEINITVALMDDYSFKNMKSLGERINIQLYAPEAPRVDYNLLLIWFMAVGTVVTGAYWSGLVKNQQRLRRLQVSRRRAEVGGRDEAQEEAEAESEQETFDVSPKFILIFVVLMCAMLVSLYFLYDYLVYFIIALFTVASSAALYSCLKIALIRIPCIGKCRLPPTRIPLLSGQPEIRRIVLGLCCLGIGIWWAVERKADYAWILQDILGIVFCIHMLKSVRLSSLKACTILLVLLFFYDIFFVFITPLLTKTGQSVMVDVATGGDSTTGETLPMVLKVPRFAYSVLSVCSLPYSLLGFGDVLVPGLLVSYCHGFDLKVESGRIYFISTVIAYGVGLVLTFVALALMNAGQPALLYLVPCTLLTTVAVAVRRHELAHMWRGESEPKPPCIQTHDASPVPSGPEAAPSGTDQAPTSGTTTTHAVTANGMAGQAPQPAPPMANGLTLASEAGCETSSFSSDNEQQLLIQR